MSIDVYINVSILSRSWYDTCRGVVLVLIPSTAGDPGDLAVFWRYPGGASLALVLGFLPFLRARAAGVLVF